MERNRCKECGKMISKYGTRCKACDRRWLDKLHEEAQKIVDTGKCPVCGSGLVHNASILGWWQCVQYGNWKLTKGDPNEPDCSFQIFTR